MGRRLLEAAAEVSMSQGGIAAFISKRLGHTVQGGYISKIVSGDRGERIEPATLFAIAEAVGVEPKWLWLGEGPKRNAVLHEYREMVDGLRAQIRATAAIKGKTPGKASKLGTMLDKAERARMAATSNAEAREREAELLRAEHRRTGTK